MTKTVRTRLYGAALTALVFGACNGNLQVNDKQSALDGGTAGDGSTAGNDASVDVPLHPTYFPPGTGDPLNSNDCPSASPEMNDACTASEGLVCRYQTNQDGQHGYYYCGCWEAGEGDLSWQCLDNPAIRSYVRAQCQQPARHAPDWQE